jgi:hypothetical protein
MQMLCEEMHRYRKIFLMDIIEILMDATRKKIRLWKKLISQKKMISCTFGSNISLVIANVPLEIKHEQLALSVSEFWVILHIDDELCQYHWRESVALKTRNHSLIILIDLFYLYCPEVNAFVVFKKTHRLPEILSY